MTADRYTTDHHLTPEGWVNGSTWYFDHQQEVVEPPSNRVETWRCKEETRSEYGGTTNEWTCAWESPDYTPEQRRQIRESFKPPFGWPGTLPGSHLADSN